MKEAQTCQRAKCGLHAGVGQREELGAVGCSAAAIVAMGGSTQKRPKGFLRWITRNWRGERLSSTMQNSSGLLLCWTRPSCCREVLHSVRVPFPTPTRQPARHVLPRAVMLEFVHATSLVTGADGLFPSLVIVILSSRLSRAVHGPNLCKITCGVETPNIWWGSRRRFS